MLIDDTHAKRYDAIVTMKICAPNYIDEQMLDTLSILDDLRILLGRLAWMQFAALQEPIYKRLIWELMRSFVADLKWEFHSDVGYIRFRLFNQTFELNSAHFNALFHLPKHSVLAPIHGDYN